MHNPDRYPARSQSAGAQAPRAPGAWAGGGSWLARVAAVWALFTGLFFMHGALPVSGWPGAVAPQAGTATVSTAAVPETGAVAPAVRGHGPGLVRAPALTGHLYAVVAPCACHWPCITRAPRESQAGFPWVPLASGVTAAMAAPASCVLPAAVTAPRADRPPGRPGLPLPLFLGVSRT